MSRTVVRHSRVPRVHISFWCSKCKRKKEERERCNVTVPIMSYCFQFVCRFVWIHREVQREREKRDCPVMAWCTMVTCQLLTAPFKRMMELVDLGWKNNFISNHISTLIFLFYHHVIIAIKFTSFFFVQVSVGYSCNPTVL